jgi:hypothetical protein
LVTCVFEQHPLDVGVVFAGQAAHAPFGCGAWPNGQHTSVLVTSWPGGQHLPFAIGVVFGGGQGGSVTHLPSRYTSGGRQRRSISVCDGGGAHVPSDCGS